MKNTRYGRYASMEIKETIRGYIEGCNQAVQIAVDLKNKTKFAWTVCRKSMECL